MRGRVIVATYNEASSIRAVLAEMEEAFSILRRSGIDLDILLIDDSSPDGTAAIAEKMAAQLGLDLTVLSGKKAGLGAALMRGFRHSNEHAKPDFYVTMDADGQHDARQMPDLVRAHLSRGNGITIGSRWVRGGSSPGTGLLRTVLSRTGNLLVRRITSTRDVADATTSFRVIDPEVTELFSADNLDVDGYGFFSALIAVAQAHGFTIDEVPICFRPRYSGVSKLTMKDMAVFWRNLFLVRKSTKAIAQHYRADQTEWAERAANFNEQAPVAGGSFGAKDELYALASATNFFSWIVEEMRIYLGHDVLEVGAGLGTVTRLLLDALPASQVTAIEPDAELFSLMEEALPASDRLQLRHESSLDTLTQTGPGSFDSLVYVNVLEHIRDHGGELETARKLLRPGGTVAIFVPAMPSLYGSLDRKSGHYRRYRLDALRALAEAAGFEPILCKHMDMAGAVPYWATIRIGNMKSASALTTKLFDNVIVPVSRAAESVVKDPPFGKNLLLIAKRTS
jgi:glycosyltransferase involved in cell wall biosynthesis